MKRLTLILALLVLSYPVMAELGIVIDAEKDPYWHTLSGPEDGYFYIPHYASVSDVGAGNSPDDDDDLSALVWMGWDEDYLYCYAEVTDDIILVNNPSTWLNDCIELKFDPDPLWYTSYGVIGARVTAWGEDMADDPAGVENRSIDFWGDVAIEGEDYARMEVKTDARYGYNLEFRVPWTALIDWWSGKEVYVGEGEIFGLAMNVSDNDSDSRTEMIQWSAGMSDHVWNDCQLYGTVIFLPDGKLEFIPENSAGGPDPVSDPDWYYPPAQGTGPNIIVMTDTLDFGLTSIGSTDTLDFKVWNTGTVPLSVSDISSDNADFTVNVTSIEVGPGDKETISVYFTPSLEGEITGTLTISSNDPDRSSYPVPMLGLGVYPPEIAVVPDQIAFSLDEGDMDSTLLTIFNNGEGLLEFDIQLSDQAPQDADLLQKNMKIEAAIDQIIENSGIRDHEIRVTSADHLTGKETESICSAPEDLVNTKYSKAALNTGLNVAILGADYTEQLDDVQSKLLSTNQFNSVTIIDVHYTTPTLLDLQAFDAVIVYLNRTYYNLTELGNNLADYVDQGGGVVSMMFECGDDWADYLGGRWNSGQYYVINRGGHDDGGNRTLGTVSIPEHPIMRGVDSFAGGYYSYRPTTTTLTSGADLVASWSDGKPLVAVKRIGSVNRVDLGFYPVSDAIYDWYYYYYYYYYYDYHDLWDPSTDGALLMANALVYAAGGALPWCEADPMSGAVASGGNQKINVCFNASETDQGEYAGYLLIESNDPVNSEMIIPLALNVTDNTAPGAVTDLTAESAAADFAIFSWTAPGDNDMQGTAESYDLRYLTVPITESNWASATSVTDTLPDPASPGDQESARITNLTPDKTHYFALKTIDEAGHYSALSNVVEVATTSAVEGIIYLPFEEESGNVAFNYQGNADFNGELHSFENLGGRDVAINSGWTQFGFQGNALKFDGSNDYVVIPDYSGSPLDLNSALTLKVAAKLRDDLLPTGNFGFYEIISKINSSSGYALRFNRENGRLRFLIQFSSNNVGIFETSQSAWAGGKWYDLRVVFDYGSSDGNVKIYVDEELDASYAESRLLTTNDQSIIIGGGNSSYEFPGTIDEVVIHNQAVLSGVEENKTVALPQHFRISQNYPNPFNPTTTINYSLPIKSFVAIKIYNINGSLVKTLFEQDQGPGEYSVQWDGKDNHSQSLSSGIYLCRIKAGEYCRNLKMSLIK